jgi:hypothetical protein
MPQAIVALPTRQTVHAHVIAHPRECTRNARGPDMPARTRRKDPKAADQKNLGRCHISKVVNIGAGVAGSVRDLLADPPAVICGLGRAYRFM